MKKLIIVAIALFTLNVSAAEKPVKPNENLRTEIVKLLKNDNSFNFIKNDITIEVLFTINSRGELIIISANTQNENVERIIKNKLNYKTVNFKIKKEGELFLLPLHIKKL